LYSLAGATLGAGASFLIARYLAAGWAARTAGGRLSQVLGGVEAEGWRFVAFARLMPIFPFNLLNYALGLTRISFRGYLAATAIFMVPGALAYSWLGYAGREALGGGEGLVRKVLIGLALVAAVAFLPRLARGLRAGQAGDSASMPGPGNLTAAELARRLTCREAIPVLDVRPVAAYGGELGHIAGSLNIPLDQLPRRLSELDRFREGPLAVICRTNRMSSQAVALLRASGFGGALLVTDGMQGWHRLHDGRQAGAAIAAKKYPSTS
jgi:rhodanese-related sulfurtransferase